MRTKVIVFICVFVALMCSLCVPAFAIYNISVPFTSEDFTLIPAMSYYINGVGARTPFAEDTGTWVDGSPTRMLFNVPNAKGIVPAFLIETDTSATWNMGEILHLSMTIVDTGGSAEFIEDPSQYRVLLTSGNTTFAFVASTVTYEGTSSLGYRFITVEFNSVHEVDFGIAVSGSILQFQLPFSIPASGTSPYISVDFGQFSLISHDSIENINTEKVVTAITGSTDKILYDWEPDNTIVGDMDDLYDEYSQAEQNGLGGKTEEEIQQDVDNVLNLEKLPDASGDGVAYTTIFLNDLLDALGPWFLSLISMSCAIALALTIIGRKWKGTG